MNDGSIDYEATAISDIKDALPPGAVYDTQIMTQGRERHEVIIRGPRESDPEPDTLACISWDRGEDCYYVLRGRARPGGYDVSTEVDDYDALDDAVDAAVEIYEEP